MGKPVETPSLTPEQAADIERLIAQRIAEAMEKLRKERERAEHYPPPS